LKFQRGISSPPKLKLNNKRINLEIFNIYISIQSKKEKFFSYFSST
jgi:hypothetical protein